MKFNRIKKMRVFKTTTKETKLKTFIFDTGFSSMKIVSDVDPFKDTYFKLTPYLYLKYDPKSVTIDQRPHSAYYEITIIDNNTHYRFKYSEVDDNFFKSYFIDHFIHKNNKITNPKVKQFYDIIKKLDLEHCF